MLRRALSLLIVFALMACFGAMLPADAPASAPMAMHMDAPAMAHDGCMHHHRPHMACHDCPICTGVDLPRLAEWDHRVAVPAPLRRAPAHTTPLAGVRGAGLDRPPRHQG